MSTFICDLGWNKKTSSNDTLHFPCVNKGNEQNIIEIKSRSAKQVNLNKI